MRKYWILGIILIALLSVGFYPGGLADQPDFPLIYIDADAGDGGVGSEASPYNEFSDINWTTGGDNSVFDAVAAAQDVVINLAKGVQWDLTYATGNDHWGISTSGTAAHPITVQAYGSGADPIVNGLETISGSWSAYTTEFNTNDNPSSDPQGNESNVMTDVTDDNCTSSAESTIKNVGSYSIKCAWATHGSGNQWMTVDLGSSCSSGTQYTISFDYYGNAANASLSRVGLSTSGVSGAVYNDLHGTVAEDSAWHSYETTVTANASHACVLFWWGNATTGETSYFDNISVTSSVANVYTKAVSGDVKRCILDGDDSGKPSSAAGIDGTTYIWYHDGSTTLYVYATEDPDSAYTTVQINRIYRTLYLDGVSYINFDDITFQGSWRGVQFNGTCSYIEFDDCDFWSMGDYGIMASVTAASGDTINNITVTNCDVDGKLNMVDTAVAESERIVYDGIYLKNACSNWSITNNTITDIWHSGVTIDGAESGEAGCDSNIIASNTFDGTNSTYMRAFSFAGVSGKCTNNIFRFNLVSNVNVRNQIGGATNSIYYNLFHTITETPATNHSNDSECLSLEASAGYVCTGNSIYNNVIYNVFNEGIMIYDAGVEPTGNLIKNNIVMKAGEGGDNLNTCLWYDTNITTGTQTISNNCFYDADTASVIDHKGTARTVAYANASLAEYSNNIENDDPLMTDPASDDFTLSYASPCIDKGTDVGLTEDYAGNPIVGLPDIGAYEFQAGLTVIIKPILEIIVNVIVDVIYR